MIYGDEGNAESVAGEGDCGSVRARSWRRERCGRWEAPVQRSQITLRNFWPEATDFYPTKGPMMDWSVFIVVLCLVHRVHYSSKCGVEASSFAKMAVTTARGGEESL